MTSELILPSKHVVLVDDEDWEELTHYNWHLVGRGIGHVSRHPGNKGTSPIFMHNQIMDHIVNKNTQVDHIDFNTLNNQRFNLEVVTSVENVRRAARRRSGERIDPYGNILPSNVYYVKARDTWAVHFRCKARGTFRTYGEAVERISEINADEY